VWFALNDFVPVSLFSLTFLGDQCPVAITGQKSSMKSTWLIKALFYLALYLCRSYMYVWDLDDDTGLRRFKQRTSADLACQLLGVLGLGDRCCVGAAPAAAVCLLAQLSARSYEHINARS
jgi:hypothetical protein